MPSLSEKQRLERFVQAYFAGAYFLELLDVEGRLKLERLALVPDINFWVQTFTLERGYHCDGPEVEVFTEVAERVTDLAYLVEDPKTRELYELKRAYLEDVISSGFGEVYRLSCGVAVVSPAGTARWGYSYHAITQESRERPLESTDVSDAALISWQNRSATWKRARKLLCFRLDRFLAKIRSKAERDFVDAGHDLC